MVLNIIPDEKFTPFLQSLFEEVLPDKNLFRVITSKHHVAFALQNKNTRVVNYTYFVSDQFRKDLREATIVIFHSLNIMYAFAALLIPKHIVIVWRGWGFDYCNYLKDENTYFELPSNDLIRNKPSIKNTIFTKRSIKHLILNSLSKTAGPFMFKKFISRTDYFSCCIPDDYIALKAKLPNFKAQFLPLNYYSSEDTFLRGDNIEIFSGNNILLGNSASSTNNHVEAICKLSELGISGRKVIVPLCYGDVNYAKKVIALGEKLLGESFVPLTKFSSLSEYNQIISGCGNVVMNHVRQQAVGNISAALLRGGKVYLRPENSIYKYYTRLGIKLFSLHDDLTRDNLDLKLSPEDIERNREIMSSVWAREQALRQVAFIASIEK